jgi:hypothetical protein
MDSENEGEITCPNYHIAKKPIKVKCRCGYNFSIILEHRRYHRRSVTIPGKLFQISSKKEVDDILIKSLSVTGIGFEMKSLPAMKVGDSFEIVFTLDDNFESSVREQITIKRVKGNFVGAEFLDKDSYNYELDFYVMQQFAMP